MHIIKRSKSPFVDPVGIGRLVHTFFLGSWNSWHFLSRQINLFQLLHLVILPLLVQNIIIVQIPIALIPTHPSFPTLPLHLELVILRRILQILHFQHIVIIIHRTLSHHFRLLRSMTTLVVLNP